MEFALGMNAIIVFSGVFLVECTLLRKGKGKCCGIFGKSTV